MKNRVYKKHEYQNIPPTKKRHIPADVVVVVATVAVVVADIGVGVAAPAGGSEAKNFLWRKKIWWGKKKTGVGRSGL